MILAFIGTTELLLIAALALLLFGGKKLPELMRGLGKGVREFKEGVKEVSNITEDTTETKQADKEE
jgi:twin arginine-targeting protein translocase, TatA/E family